MFIYQYVFSVLLIVAASQSALIAQYKTEKKVILIQSENENSEQYKGLYNAAVEAANQANVSQNEDFDLDKYINSIDWEAEQESILKWYSTLPEEKNNGDKK